MANGLNKMISNPPARLEKLFCSARPMASAAELSIATTDEVFAPMMMMNTMTTPARSAIPTALARKERMVGVSGSAPFLVTCFFCMLLVSQRAMRKPMNSSSPPASTRTPTRRSVSPASFQNVSMPYLNLLCDLHADDLLVLATAALSARAYDQIVVEHGRR